MSEVHALVDFGICVILWLVQCIIYPSFLHMEGASMIDWHKAYVFRFTCIIAPLMILQLICAAWAVWAFGTALSWLILILVMTCWGLSFFVSVPLHRQIDQGDPTQIKRRRLIWTNWPRTLLWTTIFVLGQWSASWG